ncbi:hypothetical protein G5B30_07645 [Sphingobacterium sp. SGG-5]|uniref:LamG-like jellyroll fold domain-containing protein n=1 Tax=Sphingobacterium sp. SGG-5 TaxID=2710881 RepID=UPI0013EDCA6E|nr:LamG-like jellyroll fold domain-containing protein [Sphingobacterium sp. SGG-5]NGM61786.1 hypothetical protein [Sphingobacterium sp. SGG-5]
MKSLKKLLHIGIIALAVMYTACQKTSFYTGEAPMRDTALAPEPVDTIAVPEAYKPYLAQVKAYEAWDKEHPIQVGQVVLLGNSLFTNWPNAQDYFDDDVIYNRSIENVVVDAVQFYSSRIVMPYNPRQVFLYVGESELQAGKSVTATFNLVKVLIEGLQYNLSGAEVTYLSLLKTPANTAYHAVYDQLNQMLANYLTDKDKLSYMDVNAAFAGTGGTIDPQYFNGDKLNTAGTQKLADILSDKLEGDKPKISTYMEFDGTTNYITVPHDTELDINMGESMTITFWERVGDHNGARFITKRNGNGYEIVANGSGLLAANLRSSDGNLGTSYAPADFTIEGNQWHHITFVYDQTGTQKICRIYRDGELITSSTTANIKTSDQDLSIPTADFVIGTQSTSTTTKLKGAVDNIRVYKTALSEAEILGDMNAFEIDDYTHIVAEWDFEEISGNTLENKAQSKHHGVIHGNVVVNQRIVE